MAYVLVMIQQSLATVANRVPSADSGCGVKMGATDDNGAMGNVAPFTRSEHQPERGVRGPG
jgi:hypothetical protein